MGYALICFLIMSSLLLTLTLSLSCFVRIENQQKNISLNRLKTKQAAKFALLLAQAQLTKSLTSDQRTTAQARILGADCRLENQSWIGVWNNSLPLSPPTWLVSGRSPSPSPLESRTAFNELKIQAGYDHDKDGEYTGIKDIPPQTVPLIRIDDQLEIAWWIEDHGIQAPLEPVKGVWQQLQEFPSNRYLDYSKSTLQLSQILHVPVFKTPFFNNATSPSLDLQTFAKDCFNQEQLKLVDLNLETKSTDFDWFKLFQNHTLRNSFLLTDPIAGGFKKDLSFAKVIPLETTSNEDLQSLYPYPSNAFNKNCIRLLKLERPLNQAGNSIDYGIIPLEAPAPTDQFFFTLAPVLTECLFSFGLATDSASEGREIYLVSKCALELWNPYAIPIRIGDSSYAFGDGYSDLIISIENLPQYTLTNLNSLASVSGSLPDQSFKWSNYANAKKFRPGMVYRNSLPPDSLNGDIGTRHQALGQSLKSNPADRVVLNLSFSNEPIIISLKTINAIGDSKVLFKAEILNYPNGTINYQTGTRNRSYWFARNKNSPDGISGMNNESLETNGYAFGFRIKLFDQNLNDWNRFLKEYEFRYPLLSVNLNEWSPTSIWDTTPAIPYDFRLNSSNCNPADFDPSICFSPQDLFHYETGSGSVGRRDRIVRTLDAPTAEKTHLSIFQGLFQKDLTRKTIGSASAKVLNSLFDHYFFSTLPDSAIIDWDGKQPLLNPRIQSIDPTNPPKLDSSNKAKDLRLINGFNINSTLPLAWAAILSPHSLKEQQLFARYELGSSPLGRPKWFKVNKEIQNGFFRHLQTALFNLTEKENDPHYKVSIQADDPLYPSQLKIAPVSLNTKRQHLAFIQPLRELSQTEVETLSKEIVDALIDFYAIHKHPPLSIRQFLNEAILQKAIDATLTINAGASDPEFIPQGTLAHFSQLHLMNHLAPFAFTRSDTFTIHAYAIRTDPLNKNLRTASCLSLKAQRQYIPNEQDPENTSRNFAYYDLTEHSFRIP